MFRYSDHVTRKDWRLPWLERRDRSTNRPHTAPSASREWQMNRSESSSQEECYLSSGFQEHLWSSSPKVVFQLWDSDILIICQTSTLGASWLPKSPKSGSADRLGQYEGQLNTLTVEFRKLNSTVLPQTVPQYSFGLSWLSSYEVGQEKNREFMESGSQSRFPTLGLGHI